MYNNTVAIHFASMLQKAGIKRVFTMAGGMITHLLDAIHSIGSIDIVCMHHEQAAAFAAESEGRISNCPGIVIATSGPGATNLMTGVASCYFDSIPAIFITGQVPIQDCVNEQHARQTGFQETNIVEIVKSITKSSCQPKNAVDAIFCLMHSFHIACSGRPGPVLIDLPMDVQMLPVEGVGPAYSPDAVDSSVSSNDFSIIQLFSLLSKAKRPLALIGGGVRAARSSQKVRHFLERLNIPAVSSLMGLDVLPGDHPLRMGFIGVYGNRWANWALAKADFLLVLGSRLNVRVTGGDIPRFLNDKTLFRVDCDQSELQGRVKAQHSVQADLSSFLQAANQYSAIREIAPLDTGNWLSAIRAVRSLSEDVDELQTQGINPNKFMRELSAVSSQAAAFVSDVGNNQLWAAQSLRIHEGQRILNSCGLGAMGFSLPAAIGAAFSTGRPVVSISGDGGFLVNVQELQTIVRNRLPVKMVVLNNRVLGLVRGYQANFFGGRVVATQWGYDAPDFVDLARAFKIPATSIDTCDCIEKGLSDLWRDPLSPYLLEVKIDNDMLVVPNMIFGNTHDTMYPPRALDVPYEDFA